MKQSPEKSPAIVAPKDPGPIAVVGDLLAGIGRSLFFLLAIFSAIPAALARPRILIQQVYSIGVLSLVIIVVSAIFVGMVLALQGYRLLVDFGAEEALGVSVALTVVRELGPVVAALLFAGRACSSVAAEIGLMKATDQLSAMEMMAVDPIKRIVTPRWLAGVISLPLLTAIFCVMAIGVTGGHLVGVEMLGVDAGSYWSQIQDKVDFKTDVINLFIKSVVFAVLINWIAVYQGYHAAPTAAGVSRATTNTVVIASLAILGANLMLSALMFANF